MSDAHHSKQNELPSQEEQLPENLEAEEGGLDSILNEGVEEVEEVDQTDEQQLIGDLQAQVLLLKDQALRAQAEIENIRRRSQEEVSKARKFGTESFSESLIPVKDSLEAALALENQSLEALKEGMETTLRQLTVAFERNHLKEISPAVGDKFDPNLHQAISSVPNPEVAANGIIQVLQKGYTISERVLRPALVMVSAG